MQMFHLYNNTKIKIYHIVKTVPIFNRKVIETGRIDTPNTHIHALTILDSLVHVFMYFESFYHHCIFAKGVHFVPSVQWCLEKKKEKKVYCLFRFRPLNSFIIFFVILLVSM